jgi:hypothetical protein
MSTSTNVSPRTAAKLRTAIATMGLAELAKRSHTSASVITRAAAGLPVRAASLAMLERALDLEVTP